MTDQDVSGTAVPKKNRFSEYDQPSNRFAEYDQSPTNRFSEFDESPDQVNDRINEQMAERQEKSDRGFFNNTARLAGERATDLAGGFVDAISVADTATPEGMRPPMMGMPGMPRQRTQEQREKQRAAGHQAAESLRDIDLGADKGRYTLAGAGKKYEKGDYLGSLSELFLAGNETVLSSLPDMVGAAVLPITPAYVMARNNELATENAKNKGLDRPTAEEMTATMPFAVGATLLERILPSRLLRGTDEITEEAAKEISDKAVRHAMKRTASEAGQAAIIEGGTEFVQEGILEYVAERIGTDTEMDLREMLARGGEGALLGAIGGGTLGAGRGAYDGVREARAARLQERATPEAVESELDGDVDVDAELAELMGDLDDVGPRGERQDASILNTDNADLETEYDVGLTPVDNPVPGEAVYWKPEGGDQTLAQFDGIAGEMGGEQIASVIVNGRQELVPMRDLFSGEYRERGTPDTGFGGPAEAFLPDDNSIDYEPVSVPTQDSGLSLLEPGQEVDGIDFAPPEQPSVDDKARPVMDAVNENLRVQEQEATRQALESETAVPVSPSIDPSEQTDLYPADPTAPRVGPAAERVDATGDIRLARPEYRDRLEKLTTELEKGGGVSYLRDEHDRITGRTPSVNPDWFKAMNENADTKMSVEDTRAAIEKALKGEKLGVRQLRVVGTALDAIGEERGSYAREIRAMRENARQDRRQAYEQWLEATNVPADADFEATVWPDSPGEVYNEPDYLPHLEMEARALAELTEAADALGVDWNAIDHALDSGDINSQTQALTQLVWDAQNEHRQARKPEGTRATEASSESGSRPGASRPLEKAPTDQAPVVQRSSELVDSADPVEQTRANMAGRNDAEKPLVLLRDMLDMGTDSMNDAALPAEIASDAVALSERISSALNDGGDIQALRREAVEQIKEWQSSDDLGDASVEFGALLRQLESQAELESRQKASVKAEETGPRKLQQHIKANTEVNPTEAQKEAGNYRKASINVQGLDVSIEIPRGSTRSGTDAQGNRWESKMHSNYGYIRRTTGADGENVDVFVGPNPASEKVFIVDQVNQQDGSYDESKVMLGFDSKLKARSGYKSNYNNGWKVGPITSMSMDEFKAWLKDGNTSEPMKPDHFADAGKKVGSSQAILDSSPEPKQSKPDQENKPQNLPELTPEEYTVDAHNGLFREIIEKDGNVPLERVKQAFDVLVNNPEAVKANLSKLTIKQLTPIARPNFSGEKKARLVQSAYGQLVMDYGWLSNRGAFLTHSGDMVGMVKGKMESTTAEHLKEFAEERQQRQRDHEERMAKLRKSAENPETLAEFETFIEMRGKGKLSPAQLKVYDELRATADLEARKNNPEKTTVKSDVTGVDYEMHQTVHAKKGTDLYVLKLSGERLDKDKFNELRSKAKQLGGYYSGFSRNGAIPGFQFPDAQSRADFAKVIDGEAVDNSERVTERQEEKQDRRVAKLLDMAERLEERGDASLSQDRRTGTARQANMASNAERDARQKIEFARILRSIAEAVKEGNAPFLANLNAATQLEELLRLRKQAIPAAMLTGGEYNGFGMTGRELKEGITLDDYAHLIELPKLELYNDMMVDAARDMQGVPGLKLISNRWSSIGSRSDDRVRLRVPREDFEKMKSKAGTSFTNRHGHKDTYRIPWQLERAAEVLGRLERAGITSNEHLRSAIRELDAIERGVEKVSVDPLKAKERELIGKNIPGFFPTPDAVVSRLIEEADIQPGMKVLEPSAGKGDIADAIKSAEPGADLDVVEFNSTLRDLLEAKGYAVTGQDFLEHSGEYDRIVMNPPFEKNADIDHVRHAYSLLKPGGRLVAITSGMAGHRQDKTNREFKEFVEEQGGVMESLPDGSFKSSFRPTGVSTQIVVIDKPGESKFSVSDSRPTRKPISREAATGVIDRIKKAAAASQADIRLVDSYKDMPEAIKRSAEYFEYDISRVRGAYHNGSIYLNRETLGSESAVEETIFHELYGHHGIKLIFNSATRQAMGKLYLRVGGIEGILKLAEKHNVNLDKYQDGLGKAVNKGKISREAAQSILAEELLAHIAQDSKPSIMRALQEFIGAVRAWLRARGFLEKSKVSNSEIMNLLARARQAVSEGRVTGSKGLIFDLLPSEILEAAPAFSLMPNRTRKIIGDDPVLAGWTMLAQNDDAFQLPTSDKKMLTAIFKELEGPEGMKIERADELAMQMEKYGAKASWRITTPNGDKAAVYQKGKAVWIDVSALKQGEDGKRIYNAVANYAHNTDRVFIGDPDGLSDVALTRRLENMVSSALKFGTTKHLWPHSSQIEGNKGMGVPGIKWKDGDDAHNLRQMIDASYQATVQQFPKIRDLSYNPKTDRFEDASNGNSEFKRSDFRELAEAARAVSDSGGKRPSPTAGRTTLERAVLTNTLSRGTRQEVSDILAKFVRFGSERLTGPDNAVLYSIDSEPRPSAGVSRSGDALFSIADDSPLFAAPREAKLYGIPKDAILRKVTDKMRPLLLTQREIEKAQGTPLEEALDAYRMEEAFHGKTENDIRKLRERFVEPLTKKMAEHNVTQEELDMFLWARHAPERNAQIAKINPDMPDGGSGMTNAQALQVLNKAKADGKLQQLSELSNFIYAMQKRKQELLSQHLVDQDQLNAWNENYKYYVPLKGRALDESNVSYPRVGKGFDIRGKESLRALGRRTQPESPVLHSIIDTSEAIIRARKNEVGLTFLDLVEQYPNPDYWEVYTSDSPDLEPRLFKTKDGETVGQGPVIDRSKYFSVKRGGQEHFIKINDELLMKAMKNMGPEPMNKLTQYAAHVSRFLSSVNTSFNPEFVVTNAARDIQTAVVNVLAEQDLHNGRVRGKEIAAKMVKSAPKAAYAIRMSLAGKQLKGDAGEWQKMFDQFREDGAKTGWFDAKDLDGQKKDLQRMLSLSENTVKGSILRTKKAVGEFIENTNSAVENAVRLSVYKHALDAGVSRKKASELAKNLTVNFNRKGEIGQTMNALYMFFNASVQGTMTFARAIGTLKEVDGKKKLNAAQKVGLAAAAGAFGLAVLNREMAGEDDDGENWYDKVPDWVKERNIVIMKSMVGGEPGEYWKFPLPYGYNIFHVFGTQVEAMTLGTTGVGEGAMNIAAAAVGSFVPLSLSTSDETGSLVARSITPTVGKPFIDLAYNENFWGGPIYRDNMDFSVPKADAHLYKRSTPEIWKGMAQFMNKATGGGTHISGMADVNPDSLDYLFKYFTGGAGAFAGRLQNVVTKTAMGVEVEAREIPFLRQVTGKVAHWDDVSKFYDRLDDAKRLEAEWKTLNGKDRIAFYKEHGAKIRLKTLAEGVTKDLSSLRKQRDRIEGSKLSAREKDERLKKIEERMKRAVDRLNRSWPGD